MKIIARITQGYSKIWIGTGHLALEGLILLPTHTLMTATEGATLPDQTPLAFITFILPSLGLFIAAFLLFSALNLFNEWRNTDLKKDWDSHVQHRWARWITVTALTLCIILPAKSLHNLF